MISWMMGHVRSMMYEYISTIYTMKHMTGCCGQYLMSRTRRNSPTLKEEGTSNVPASRAHQECQRGMLLKLQRHNKPSVLLYFLCRLSPLRDILPAQSPSLSLVLIAEFTTEWQSTKAPCRTVLQQTPDVFFRSA